MHTKSTQYELKSESHNSTNYKTADYIPVFFKAATTPRNFFLISSKYLYVVSTIKYRIRFRSMSNSNSEYSYTKIRAIITGDLHITVQGVTNYTILD